MGRLKQIRKIKAVNGALTIIGAPYAFAANRWRKSLSAKLFLLTVIAVLVAEAFVLAPSIAKRRVDFLNERIEQAYLVSIAAEAPNWEMIDQVSAKSIFETANILEVRVFRDGAYYQVMSPAYKRTPQMNEYFVDLREQTLLQQLMSPWSTLASRGEAIINLAGAPKRAPDEMVNIVVSQRALRDTLWAYTRNILGLSLLISTLTAALIYSVLNKLIVKPVKRLTRDMVAFQRSPERPTLPPALKGRKDEIGAAQETFLDLQTRIRALLEEQRRLAALGAGISKISHDLRNILASAQLMSDRLAKSDDPRMRKLSPRLLSALDRAVALSNDTLSYGRMEPGALKKDTFPLKSLGEEILEDVADLHIQFENLITDDVTVQADRNQLYRALFNLLRNAVEALNPPSPEADHDGVARSIMLTAQCQNHTVHIDVIDNGPGLPDTAREHLFEPFKGSRKPGGSGLGLAIAHEIMRAHGGDLALLKSDANGTTFRLHMPNK